MHRFAYSTNAYTKWPLEKAVARLVTRLGVDPAEVRGPDRGRRLATARALLAFVLIRRLAYRATDVAALLGRDPATLGKAITRLAARAQRDDVVVNQLCDLGDCPEVKV